jgi:hypothetical protein
MSLYLDGKVDAIAAIGGRELDFIPKHFHCVSLGTGYFDQRIIRNWIWTNQIGRFCISARVKLVNGTVHSENVVAFEDSGEAIMFSFILPTLQSNIFDDFI